MADYVLPSAVEKRVRYFDGQFLQDQDFIDEQDYQIDREHRHNRLLHGPGIAEGLTVTPTAPNQVTVAPGTALDSDGNQLVLADATTVDLPAAKFSNQQGVQLYLSYLESAEDPQTVAGSADFTRWLERPELTALTAGESYEGTSSPVLLARLALDSAGRVTVDATARVYSGLRLPGPAADAVTLTTASSGLAHLAGSLTVDGHVGVGNPAPVADLEVGNFDNVDRFIALKAQGGNAHRVGLKLFTWQENFGYSIQFDERPTIADGLHIKTHNVDATGVTRMFIGQDGNVGIGNVAPGARLDVTGAGGTNVDLQVNGRLRSNSNDGGLWVAGDRFVGGFTNQIGFWNGGNWRLNVTPAGTVGIATGAPVADLEIGDFGGGDRFVALKAAGGDAHRVGLKLFTWKEDFGYSILFDERAAGAGGIGPNGLHVKTHNADAAGVTRLFVTQDGNVGVGNTAPACRLDVTGSGGTNIDLQVNGRLRSNSNDGGLWVAADRFIGGHSTSKLGLWNGNAFRLTVDAAGNVGIGTLTPAVQLDVAGAGGANVDLQVNGRLRSNSNDGGLWVSTDRFVGGFTNQVGFYNGGAWRLNVTPTGNVGIATATPVADLEIGNFDNVDRFIALKAQGGNAHRVGLKLFTWQENYGYSIQFDERGVIADGLHIKTHNVDATGVTRMFIGQDGNVAIGAVNAAGQKLLVAGSAQVQGDFFVNGRLVYWWGPDGAWKQVQNRSGDMAGSYSTGGPSDLRLKTGLRPIGDAVATVRQLRGMRYQWGDAGLDYLTRGVVASASGGPGATEEQHEQARQTARRKALDELAGDHLGLIAQDVEAVVPELVHQDADGYKHISYHHLTALLVEAIKEQDETLRALASQLAVQPLAPGDSAA
jgi:hypothetical protein